MVALNWQSVDEGVMLNEAMFAGEQGWVLKPPGYRSDPSGTEVINFKTLHLKLTVYAAQHIPMLQSESGFHPYIRCELHVEKLDESKSTEMREGNLRARGGEYKQRTPHGKGDHPDFGEEGVVMEFPVATGVLEELSFVRLVISYAEDISPTPFHTARFIVPRHGFRGPNQVRGMGSIFGLHKSTRGHQVRLPSSTVFLAVWTAVIQTFGHAPPGWRTAECDEIPPSARCISLSFVFLLCFHAAVLQ